MKKALNITIAGTLFTIEEDAYEALNSYLESIQAHFSSDPDKAEIVKDIEARIAEQLMERQSPNGIVSVEVVRALISIMGRVEDFGDSESAAAGQAYQAKRKFYRDPDDVVIAGVCSGIAAYFGLDPVVVRLAFVILVVLGFGAGVVIYLILALVVPKAETPAEKLQMKGGPVKLSSFKESVEEQIARVNKKGSAARTFLENVFGLFGKMLRLALRVLRLIVGVGFLGGALFGGVAFTFAFVNLIFNKASVFMRFPITDAVTDQVYTALVGNAYLLVLIPVIFIGALGFRLLTKRKALNFAWVTGLGALWIIALIVFGSIGVRYAPTIAERAQELNDEYAEARSDIQVPPIPPLPANF